MLGVYHTITNIFKCQTNDIKQFEGIMRVTNWSLTIAGNFGAYTLQILNIFLSQTYQYLENSNLTTILT